MDFEPTDFEYFPPEELQKEAPTGFDSLVENALDFLKQALEEVKDSPKYSVIHFCAGIELLLKARLLHEHWSLVLLKPGETSKQNFETGKFESVTIWKCFERLENVCGEKLKEERECFSELAEHRNNVIHFFHPAYVKNPDAKVLEKIVIQQLRAGALLMRLLRHRWEEQFDTHSEAINELERSLRHQKQYLKAKYDLIKPRLKEFKAQGGKIWVCFLCDMNSAQVIADEPLVKKTRCLVCETSRNFIKIPCPVCKESNVDSEIDFDVASGTCEECDTTFGLDFLMSEFQEEGIAYCPECSFFDQHSVIQYGDEYFCLACGSEYKKVGTCDWCSEEVAGDTSDSYLIGCMMCSGYAGHHADD